MKDDTNFDKFYMPNLDEYEEGKDAIVDDDYDTSAESYDDGEAYDDEPQDEEYDEEDSDENDGYDDQYYDDRLSKVLDELADLKRGITAPTAQPQSGYVSQNNTNDVVMYNEISRLREELNKNQSAQNLHAELSKLKEEMDKEKKNNEASFLQEIKRLNKKIASLADKQIPTLNATSEKMRLNSSQDSSVGAGVSSNDFAKLVNINESILRDARDVDAKVQSEISSINAKLDSLPNFDELNATIANIKKGVKIVGTNTSSDAILNQVNTLKNKLNDVDNYFENICNASNYNNDVNESIKNLIESAISVSLNRDNFTDFLSFSEKINEISISDAKKDAIDRYINIIELVSYQDGDALIDLLPELVGVIKEILNINSKFDYESIQNKINLKSQELKNEKNKNAIANIYSSIAEMFKEFNNIKICDVVNYIPSNTKANSVDYEDANKLLKTLDDLKIIVSGLNLSYGDNSSELNSEVLNEIVDIKELIINIQTMTQDKALSQDKNNLNVYTSIKELKNDNSLTKNQMIESLSAIKSKLCEQSLFINKIGDLRADILNVLNTSALADSTIVTDELTALKAKINEIIDNNNVNNAALLNGLSDIKEQVHFKELQKGLSTITSSEEEQQILTKEIQELRELLTKTSEDSSFIRNQIEANIELSDAGSDDILANEDVGSLMQNISAIKEKLNALDEYDTVAEILSLREDVKASRIVDTNDVSNELEGIKAEISELKTELLDLKAISNEISRTNNTEKAEVVAVSSTNPTGDEINMLLSEVVSLRDEIQSYKDDVNNIIVADRGDVSDAPKEDDNISTILDELTGLRSELNGYREESNANNSVELKDGIAELKNLITRRTTLSESDNVASNELNVVLDQIVDLKNEVDVLKEQLAIKDDSKEEILAIKQMLQDFIQNSQSVDNSVVTTELAEIKDQLNTNSLAALAFDNNSELAEILSLREELTQFKDQIIASSNASIAVEPDTAVLSEVMSLREEFVKLQEIVNNAKMPTDLEESIDTIKNDINIMKNEPDLSIINEVLALREEFQNFKDELNKSRVSDDKPNVALLSEVKSLREQIFAISMANVNDGKSEDVVYESYNNIILDEISSIHDELGLMNESDATKNLAEQLSEIKKKLSNMAVDESESLEAKFAKLSSAISAISQVLEKQNKIIAQIQDSISSNNTKKAELEAVATKEFNNEIKEEIIKLKDQISKVAEVGGEASSADLTKSINDLKDELNSIANYVNDESKSKQQKPKTPAKTL